MKKFTRIGLMSTFMGVVGLTTAFHFSSFTLTSSDDPRQFATCDGLQKNSNGTQTALTQSVPDQQPSPSGTCSGCHSGGSTTPSVTISANPAFGVGDTYVPGQTYTITYQVTGYSKFGFDLEMNDGNTASSMTAGTLSAVSNTRYTAKPYNRYPANITHNSPVSSSSSAVFQWVAPSTPTTVYLFSNALGVNGTGGTGGDKETFKNMVLTPEGTNGISNIEIQSIKGVYPNPSSDNITVEYQISKKGNLKMEILSLNGQLVRVVSNETVSVGIYSKTINIAQLEKGSYFIKLTSENDDSQIKRFVVE
jgi:hypothetical protein